LPARLVSDIENVIRPSLSILKTEKNKGGRPRTDATPLGLRLPPDVIMRLDAWIAGQDDRPTRVEAVRRILAAYLPGGRPRK